MCGIIGVISAKVTTLQQDKHFKQLLIMDQVRGFDSVGVMAEKVNGNLDFYKHVYDPATFLEDKKTKAVLSTAKAMVGHNRAATRGNVTPMNAHPFSHGPITLVHNGTLTHPLPAGASQFEVDSESIAYGLSQVEPAGAAAFLESLNGAYALCWYDSRDRSWNIARNSERPLHYMTLTTGDTMYISSERGILYACVSADITIEDPVKCIPMLPEGEIHKITTVAGKLHKEVVTFSPKKPQATSTKGMSLLGNVGAGKTTTTSGTVDTGKKKIGRSVYEQAKQAFLNKLDLTPGYHSVNFDKKRVDPETQRVLYIGWLNVEPYNEIHLFSSQELDMSGNTEYEVFINTLYLNSFGNNKAHTVYDYTLTSNEVRESKKQPPAGVTGGVLLDGCVNCGAVHPHEDMYQLRDGDSLCVNCYQSDVNDSKQYAHQVGIAGYPK